MPSIDETASSASAGSDRHRPYRMVGLVLLGLVVIVLSVAFFVNQRLRPHVGVASLPATAPAKALPTPGGHKGQGTLPVAAPTAAASATTVTSTVRPSPILTPRQQVQQAYHNYWQDYSQALYTLDTSHMSDVATGDELKRVQAEVAGFRQENRAVHVQVAHNALIVAIKGATATLYDEQHDGSFLIDPVTKEPHHGPNKVHVEKDIYFLKKINGIWKVTKSLRQKG